MFCKVSVFRLDIWTLYLRTCYKTSEQNVFFEQSNSHQTHISNTDITSVDRRWILSLIVANCRKLKSLTAGTKQYSN